MDINMKFIHLSDLHIGKRLNEYSLLEDQEYILHQIVEIIDNEKPDAVIIAGDVYDKSVPSAEAVKLFDDFLFMLSERNLQVFVISGNHDSPERIAFGSRLMDSSGIHMSPVYNGSVCPTVLSDEFGDVKVYMLPFVKPANVRRFCEEEINSYTEAIAKAIEMMDIDSSGRNVIVTHQFVTGASRSESEEISVGGSDNVDADVFSVFDYVALGHLHSPQCCGNDTVRYCGTPLKYSFSEASDEKSVTVVVLEQKGKYYIKTVPLKPLRDMVEIRGKYDELTLKSYYDGTTLCDDYVHITLTDEEDIPDAAAKLHTVYHGLMKLDYDNKRTRSMTEFADTVNTENRTPADLFAEFYEKQNGKPMDTAQTDYINELIQTLEEEQI